MQWTKLCERLRWKMISNIQNVESKFMANMPKVCPVLLGVQNIFTDWIIRVSHL